MTITRSNHRRTALFTGICLAAVVAGAPGLAAAQSTTSATDTVSEVVVTGYRASLQSALNLKKNSDVMMDAINAEDIADFPDSNLAESLQRLPGISIDRDNGEGRTISVRGLSGDFSRVRINNMEALSTGAALSWDLPHPERPSAPTLASRLLRDHCWIDPIMPPCTRTPRRPHLGGRP